ncbi:helix-turn-helix transcriptional regulator [Vibrio sp.]|uniref:Transcriptional regulator n=1 Tax=Vibrio viridaestus TaxID=2487322 RepID=A0A3N9TKQ3_9VIBR|nr:helix-turn-helix domain-containing protein [Vibrio viridaestus]MDC0611848.1 helix-turn-helix transcriptional regulator [Vibrio sp.]RQW64850.1 transcriptional regulator [Vibrio viridaestus]
MPVKDCDTPSDFPQCQSPCAIERGMRILGSKWKGTILWHLKDGPVRFNDLSRMISGASKKMIDQRLKELEQQKMVTRNVLNTRPIAVSYELTEFGRTALAFLEDLKLWVEENEL